MKKFLLGVTGLLTLVMITACACIPAIYQEMVQIHNLSDCESGTTTVTPVLEVPNSSCENSNADNNYDSEEPRTYWQGLHMYVAADSVTPVGLRLSMINESELNFGHGVMFSIEQYSEGEWEQVPFINDIAWIQPLLIVAPKTTVDENISWEHMHGVLQPGQYRIVRNFIEEDWDDPTPPWERDIPTAYLYTTFSVEQDWEDAHSRWQNEQDALTAIAYARFDGLDLEILEYSPRGLSFTLTNNNPDYSYIINSVFVGWEDNIPGVGGAGALEYFIFPGWSSDDSSWPFGDDKRLQPEEYFFLEVDWYNEIGNLAPSMARLSPNPYVFDVVIDVTLDVNEEYIKENFRRIIPGLPNADHRVKAYFDISP